MDALTAAGVALPTAAALWDPTMSLPAGLVPVGGSTGAAQAGAAQLPRQPTSLPVLPAETVPAVSTAGGDLGPEPGAGSGGDPCAPGNVGGAA